MVQRTWVGGRSCLKMISSTSLCEMGSLLNGMVAGGRCGSQAGLVEWNGSGWGLW